MSQTLTQSNNRNNPKRVVTLTGPSGSGKTEMIQYLKSTGKFKQLVSVTTRKPRPGEVDGVDYYFIDQERFDNLFKSNELLQSVVFNGVSYGTPMHEMTSAWESGLVPMVVVEPTGVTQFLNAGTERGFGVTAVFVAADLDVLIDRYCSRLVGEIITSEQAHYHAKRLASVTSECETWASRYNWDLSVVNNGTMEEFLVTCQSVATEILNGC